MTSDPLPETDGPDRRARLRSIVHRAATQLAPSWPLERFVATNPLLALEDRPIEQAAHDAIDLLGLRTEHDEETYRRWYHEGRITDDDLTAAILGAAARSTIGDPPASDEAVTETRRELLSAAPVSLPRPRPVLLSEWHDLAADTRWAAEVDDLSSWWCAAYLGDHPAWAMPGRDEGLYPAWRRLAEHDPRMSRLCPDPDHHPVRGLPDRPDDAVLQLLSDLGIEVPDHAAYLRRHLIRNAGWVTAIIRSGGPDGDDLVGYLAVRLSVELGLLSNGASRDRARHAAASVVVDDAPVELVARRLGTWRDAYERGFRDRLLSRLPGSDDGSRADRAPTRRPASHAVFCIDPRSEGMRRHLEAIGDHATIGFAGFFGLAIAVTDLDAGGPVPSCPVIVEPEAAVVETELSHGSSRRHRGVAASHALHDVFATTKRSTSGPFALAEALGWVSGPWMAARTLAPTAAARLGAAMQRWLVPEAATTVEPAAHSWWSPAEQVRVAASILRATGLDRHAAPLVMLCGHSSRHLNNLHRAALDCGACGGRPGGNNARAAANLLNNPEVRHGLAAAGIDVPRDTWFVAAEHDTTTDHVHVLDRDTVPPSHRVALVSLESDLAEAGSRLASERGAQLPADVGRMVGSRGGRVRRRGHDWAQVIPEWGLVGNAAIVIGPRSLTAHCDLQRRVFLHSYDATEDHDGTILATIMGGPLLVAHWISSQYRLSTIEPDRLGAGTKPAHNLIGGVGVIEGTGGDLRLGLPFESVGRLGHPIHEPMRLLAVIDAPADHVERAAAANAAVARIIDNGWIRLAARPDSDDLSDTAWMLRRRNRTWDRWNPSSDRAALVGSSGGER